MKISNKWRKMSQVYKLFAERFKRASFTEEDAEEVYLWESTGKGNLKAGVFPDARADGTYNGYVVGKVWKDWHVTEWRAAVKEGRLFPRELYLGGKYPKWWLDKIFEKKAKEAV